MKIPLKGKRPYDADILWGCRMTPTFKVGCLPPSDVILPMSEGISLCRRILVFKGFTMLDYINRLLKNLSIKIKGTACMFPVSLPTHLQQIYSVFGDAAHYQTHVLKHE